MIRVLNLENDVDWEQHKKDESSYTGEDYRDEEVIPALLEVYRNGSGHVHIEIERHKDDQIDEDWLTDAFGELDVHTNIPPEFIKEVLVVVFSDEEFGAIVEELIDVL